MKKYNYIILVLTSIIYLSLCNTIAVGQDSKKYYLIAGSLKTETEAQHTVDSLKALGYPSEIVGKSDYGTIRVSFNSFDNYNDATKELNRIKNQVTQNVWILEAKAVSSDKNTNNNTDDKNKKSNKWSWLWWVGGIILILIILGIIFDSRCPKCKKFFSKKFICKEEMNRKPSVKTVDRVEIIRDKTGKETGRIQKKETIPIVKVEYYNVYECKNCKFRWHTVTIEEES